MITTISNLSKYDKLFTDAWNELYYRGKFSAEEMEYYSGVYKFTRLEEYFTKIKTLIDVGANEEYPATIRSKVAPYDMIENPRAGQKVEVEYRYIMLPLEEEAFAINGNTRDIVIPKSFQKLVSVQGDVIAETLVFTIDRFFDYMDLLNTNIYIQWKDVDGEDRATPVNMIYYDEVSQKIYFGWPIHAEITKAARSVEFSVRFLVKSGNDIVYSFNTKTHAVTIAKALQPNFSSNITLDGTTAFSAILQDSPSSAAPPADEPEFVAPGLDLPARVDLYRNSSNPAQPNNTYVLKVQAVTSDIGQIEYQAWKYTPDQSDTPVYISGENGDFEATTLWEEVKPTVREVNTVYYVRDDSAPHGYTVYTGSIPAPEGVTLYERYAALVINAGEDKVVGTYSVSVLNRTGGNVSRAITSNVCTIKGPETLIYKSNLAARERYNNSLVLSVTVKSGATDADHAATDFHYQWYKAITNNDNYAPIENSDSATLKVDSVGWYKVEVTAVRNRDTIALMSNECKVTEAPKTPLITSPVEEKAYQLKPGDTADLEVSIGHLTPIEYDTINYVWKIGVSDSEMQVVSTANASAVVDFSKIDPAKPNVLPVKNPTDNIPYIFVCEVSNTIGDTTSAAAASAPFVII